MLSEKASQKISDFFSVILSAVLLILAFPKTNWDFLAWIGLVPLLLVLEKKSPAQAFRAAYLCGFVFFWGVGFWIVHVTILGAVLLLSYVSLYFGLFGWGYAYLRRLPAVTQLVVVPSMWVALEFIREHFFTGFGWAAFGLSQYRQLPLIQIADLTGIAGVSFLLVMVNVAVKNIVLSRRKKEPSVWDPSAVIILFVIACVVIYGQFRLRENRMIADSSPAFSAAVVQGNIDLFTHWQESSWMDIINRHLDLSEQAAAGKPQMIIWPETAFPGYLWEDEPLLAGMKDFVKRTGIPILFGSVIQEEGHYYNAAVFLDNDEGRPRFYAKTHLVPYGEYIPFREQFPFLARIVPIDDFTPGADHTVFSIGDGRLSGFSALICFEDTIARVTRRFVQAGAPVLVNISNDAWFGDSKEPFMHLQAAVFRSVENRRSMIRASNTGLSCFIDPDGRVHDCVKNEQNKSVYTEGFQNGKVPVSSVPTFYTRWGDVFSWVCFAILAFGIAQSSRRKETEK